LRSMLAPPGDWAFGRGIGSFIQSSVKPTDRVMAVAGCLEVGSHGMLSPNETKLGNISD
jgi:hypothetical protein